MNKILAGTAVAFSLGIALLGCPGDGGGVSDAGVDDSGFEIPEPIISVTGKASVHPSAIAWLQANSLPVPPIAELTLRVEDPLKAATNDPTGLFGKMTLDEDGGFTVTEVDTSQVVKGIAAGIRDEGVGSDGGNSARIVRSASVLFDVELQAEKPHLNITGGKAFMLPRSFHDQLTAAMNTSVDGGIASLTPGQVPTLIEAGFMLGRLVDSNGVPVAGAKILSTSQPLRLYYPSADLMTVNQTGTSSNGLFLYVHNGVSYTVFSISVEGKPEYKKRGAGASKDSSLVLTMYPGTVPPP